MAKKRGPELWAEEMFGQADFDDPRLSSRLVRIGSDLASAIGASPGRAASDDDGAAEAFYRFVRNHRVEPSVIAQSGHRRRLQPDPLAPISEIHSRLQR